MDDKVRKNNIDWKHWLHMSEIRIGQAVALSMNLDPHKMGMTRTCEGWQYLDGAFQNEEQEGDFYQRCILLIDNAFSNKNLRSTESLLVGINQERNHTAKIHLEYFPEWALSVEWTIPKELKTLVDPKNLPKETKQEETGQEETRQEKKYALFDPVSPEEIIATFDGVTPDEWKELFKRANRNKLRELREEGDLYNTAKVGDWLVVQGKYSPQHLRNKLKNSVPDRSLDDKHVITGEYDD
tara:strand:+ start:206 stop:925 length:720 start_codon:yes stop_codon:yes gene_type:complete